MYTACRILPPETFFVPITLLEGQYFNGCYSSFYMKESKKEVKEFSKNGVKNNITECFIYLLSRKSAKEVFKLRTLKPKRRKKRTSCNTLFILFFTKEKKRLTHS